MVPAEGMAARARQSRAGGAIGAGAIAPAAPQLLLGQTHRLLGQTLRLLGQTYRLLGQTLRLPGQTLSLPGQTLRLLNQTIVFLTKCGLNNTVNSRTGIQGPGPIGTNGPWVGPDRRLQVQGPANFVDFWAWGGPGPFSMHLEPPPKPGELIFRSNIWFLVRIVSLQTCMA